MLLVRLKIVAFAFFLLIVPKPCPAVSRPNPIASWLTTCIGELVEAANAAPKPVGGLVFPLGNHFQQALQLLEHKYQGALVGPPFSRGSHSLAVTVEWLEGPKFIAKVPLRVVSREHGSLPLETYRREKAFLNRVERELLDVRDHFPSAVDLLFLERWEGPAIPVLVMSRASRGSLAESWSLFGAQRSWQSTLKHWLQLTKALAAVHRAYGIAHGDLKPGNILVHEISEGEFQLWIGDWGGYYSPADSFPLAQGTQVYQSRETLGGHYAPERDDVRAAKLVLLEMLAGAPVTSLLEANPDLVETVYTATLSSARIPTPYLTGIPPDLATQLPPQLQTAFRREQPNIEWLHEDMEKALLPHD